MPNYSINKFLSTINFCLPFIGFQLLTSIALRDYATIEAVEDFSSITQRVTIPYRAFVLLLSLIVILINYKNKIPKNKGLVLFLFFWLLLVIRLFYDLQIRMDLIVDAAQRRRIWMYSFLICLIPTISIIKSFKNINFDWAFKIIFIGFVVLIPLYYINNPMLFSDSDEGRLIGNLAVSSIAFGHFGVSLSLLSLFMFNRKKAIIKKTLYALLFLVGVFVMLRAASRGPFVALMVTCVAFGLSRGGNVFTRAFFLLISFFVVYISWDYMMIWISDVSPTMAKRLFAGNVEVTSGRNILYYQAIKLILDNPFLGYAFALYANGIFVYSHNIILDAYLGLGVIGGTLFFVILLYAVKSLFSILIFKNKYGWISLLCLQNIISGLFSSAFYLSDLLNILLVTVFILSYDKRVTPTKSSLD